MMIFDITAARRCWPTTKVIPPAIHGRVDDIGPPQVRGAFKDVNGHISL